MLYKKSKYAVFKTNLTMYEVCCTSVQAYNPPPPPSWTQKGPHACSHFLNFWCCLGTISQESQIKGVYLENIQINRPPLKF